MPAALLASLSGLSSIESSIAAFMVIKEKLASASHIPVNQAKNN
jgi:hypothetical protein